MAPGASLSTSSGPNGAAVKARQIVCSFFFFFSLFFLLSRFVSVLFDLCLKMEWNAWLSIRVEMQSDPYIFLFLHCSRRTL